MDIQSKSAQEVRRISYEARQLKPIIELAEKAHAGQTRRDGFTPAITHPQTVAKIVRQNGGSAEAIQVAWLHDVLEDSDTKIHQIENAGGSRRVQEAVIILTHPRHEPYIEYIERVRTNGLARTVKIADIKANLAGSPSNHAVGKYINALNILNA